MLRKFFPLDKNYILEEAQLSLEPSLLQYLVDFVKVEYLLRCNPLGMMDAMALKIKEHDNPDFRHLHEFYVNLMGLFRYKFYNDNQLEFSFEGKDAFHQYREEWTGQFKEWAKSFCRHHNFLRAVLDLTVFYPSDSPMLMVDNRMNAFITQYFEVRFHPQKGITKKIA
ncbi:MAG: hypothetical protein WEB30_05675 [Cyclobacteriaceae bacterium]